jgi:hypothetical protein
MRRKIDRFWNRYPWVHRGKWDLKGGFFLEIEGLPVKGVDNFVELVSSFSQNPNTTLLALGQRAGWAGYVQIRVC